MSPERPQPPESREARVDASLDRLAEQEGIDPDALRLDLIAFLPIEGNEEANEEYFKEVAEKLGVSYEELVEHIIEMKEANFDI